MDFLNYVARWMFENAVMPDNNRNVQIVMKDLHADLIKAPLMTEQIYALRLQASIEIERHIQLFGDLDKD